MSSPTISIIPNVCGLGRGGRGKNGSDEREAKEEGK